MCYENYPLKSARNSIYTMHLSSTKKSADENKALSCQWHARMNAKLNAQIIRYHLLTRNIIMSLQVLEYEYIGGDK